jgi:hypothetical protein
LGTDYSIIYINKPLQLHVEKVFNKERKHFGSCPKRHRQTENYALFLKGGFYGFFKCLFCSTLLHLPPLRIYCVGGCKDLNPELLRLRHWQSDALAMFG